MRLILFDIDGTLTATNGIDEVGYLAAFERVFSASLPTTDWSRYVHATDTAIMNQTLRDVRGTPATPDELALFEHTFVGELESGYERDPEAFREIPGAAALLQTIQSRPDLQAALATGGLRSSALFKLDKAGLNLDGLPAAFANDAESREDIANIAISRTLGEPHAPNETLDIVYVGDASWDVKTSSALGMRFIGIGSDESRKALIGLGASVCLEDYQDQAAFLDALEAATVPK